MGKLPWAVSGFFFGILIRSYLDFGLGLPALLSLLAFATALLYLVLDRESIYLLCAIFLSCAVLGVLRYEWKDQTPNHLAARLPSRGAFEALVIEEPDLRENSVRYTVKMAEAKVSVVARPNPIFKYGDVLKLDGDFGNVSESYLTKDEIYCEMVFPKISFVEGGQGNWIRTKLIAIKNWFSGNIAKLVPEPESSLAAGLVLGAKETLGKDLLDKFRVAGLIHIVVLSGYNITIVALFIMWLFGKFLSKRSSIIAGVISIILFAMMVGGGATVVRASVMAILGLLAQATGRTSEVARALVIAALIMLAINPKLLVFDLGFQLSFLATLGLIYLEPIFARFKFIQKLPERIAWLPFREIASATLGAQLAVFPLILYTFGNFSVYAFPVNMLVLPLVPTVMLLVFLVGVLSPIPLLSLLAYPVAWITYALLTYMIHLVTIVSHLPYASLTFSQVPLALPLAIYAGIIWLVLKFHKPSSPLGVQIPK